MQYMLEDLIEQGFSRFILSLYHQAEKIEAFAESFGGAVGPGIHVETVVEPIPMGTGGAILYAAERAGLDGDFFVANGDTFLPGGLRQLRGATSGADNAIALVEVPDVSRYGTVERASDGLILRFWEKENISRPGLINSGCYKLNRAAFGGLDGGAFSIEELLFPRLVRERRIFGHPWTVRSSILAFRATTRPFAAGSPRPAGAEA